jgi:hypothetical protein
MRPLQSPIALLLGIVTFLSGYFDQSHIAYSEKGKQLMTELPNILREADLENLFPDPYETTNEYERQERQRAKKEGRKASVIGRYTQIDVRQRQELPLQYQGHVAVKLETGGSIFLYPTWHPNAIRPLSEVTRYENQRVAVIGKILPTAPRDPDYPNQARIISPCFISIESIRITD